LNTKNALQKQNKRNKKSVVELFSQPTTDMLTLC